MINTIINTGIYAHARSILQFGRYISSNYSPTTHTNTVREKKSALVPLRRLPCEELEPMLQRHRRHPWCMWSGCQRPHFLLSGLMWAGQTQILAQHGLHAPPLWFQRSYPSLTVDIPSWGFVGRITGYAASQCLKCFLWATRSQTTGKTWKQQLNNTRKKYWISDTRKLEKSGLSRENSLMGLTDFWALINCWYLLHVGFRWL